MAEVLELQTHIGRLLEWLGREHTIPSWKEQLILDTSDPSVRWVSGEDRGWRLPEGALQPVASFAPRFERLLRQGYGWINLSAYGLHAGDLVFGIELPSRGAGPLLSEFADRRSKPSVTSWPASSSSSFSSSLAR